MARPRQLKFIATALLLVVLLSSSYSTGALEGTQSNRSATPAQDPFSSPSAYAIPFTYDRIDHPFISIQVSVNGSAPHAFLVDTGCDSSLIVFDWAKDLLKLHLTGRSQTVRPGNYKSFTADGVDVEMADQQGKRLRVHVEDPGVTSTYLTNLVRPQLAGIVGARFFQEVTSKIDFDRKRLVLLQGDVPRTEARQDDQSLPIIGIKGGQPLNIALDIGAASGKITYLLDTGSPSTVLPDYPPLMLKPLSVLPEQIMDGGGAGPATTLLTDSIVLGATVVPHPVLTTRHAPEFTLIGLGILSQFNIIIDPRHGDLVLEPRQFPDRRRTGELGLATRIVDNRVYVVKLRNEVAQRSGLAEGDEVISVDGDGPADVIAELISNWQLDWHSAGAEGTVAKIVVRRNGIEKKIDVLRTGFPDIVPNVLGMTLLKSPGGVARVFEVESNTPAAAANIQPDDEITAINDMPILDWTAYKMIVQTVDNEGKAFQGMKLTVKRKSDGKTIQMRVDNGKYSAAEN